MKTDDAVTPSICQEVTMSLKPQPRYTVPEETARVVRAIFPKGNLSVRTYDIFDPLFEDETFIALRPGWTTVALADATGSDANFLVHRRAIRSSGGQNGANAY
jgi:hypothetical protein